MITLDNNPEPRLNKYGGYWQHPGEEWKDNKRKCDCSKQPKNLIILRNYIVQNNFFPWRAKIDDEDKRRRKESSNLAVT